MKDATERIYPDREPLGILSIHLKRYKFALNYCKGKTVLDAACGVGYGAYHLTQVASRVVGIDIDPQAIAYGQERFSSDCLSLRVADVMNTGFSDSEFDVICSFEAIEHLSNIPMYLKEIARILSPQGVCILSTPQVSKTNHHPDNPYHMIEFARKDFEALLQEYFNDVELFGQRRKQSEFHYRITQLLGFAGLRGRLPKLSQLRNFVNTSLHTTNFDEMFLDDLVITKEKIERASEIIAVCRNPRPSEGFGTPSKSARFERSDYNE